MKSFLLFVLNLFLILEVLSAQDVCTGQPGPVFDISQALKLNETLLLFDRSGAVYEINDLKWNGTNFTDRGTIALVTKPDNWTANFNGNFENIMLAFVDVAPEGPQILVSHWDLKPISGSGVDIGLWIKQFVGNRAVHPLDVNTCNRTDQTVPIQWCAFLLYLNSTLDTKTNVKAILQLPYFNGRPYMLQYYNSPHPMRPQLFVFEGVKNILAQNQIQWMHSMYANNTNLHSRIVAVTPLTGNKVSGNRLVFDLVEFVGNDYDVYQIEADSGHVDNLIKLNVHGQISDLYDCNKTTNGTTSPSPTSSQSSSTIASTSGKPSTNASISTTVGSTPTTVGSSPTTVGSTPTTVGSTPTTVGSIPTTVASTPTTVGSSPTTVGSTPTTVASTPTTVGFSPTTVASTPTSIRTTTVPSTTTTIDSDSATVDPDYSYTTPEENEYPDNNNSPPQGSYSPSDSTTNFVPTKAEERSSFLFVILGILILVLVGFIFLAVIFWLICCRREEVPPPQQIESGPPSDAPAPAPLPQNVPSKSDVSQEIVPKSDEDPSQPSKPSTPPVATSSPRSQLELPEEPKNEEQKVGSPTSVVSVQSDGSSLKSSV